MRDYWHVYYTPSPRYPGWCVVRAHGTEHGHRMDGPLPGNYGFRTRREAEARKKELRASGDTGYRDVEGYF